MRTSYLLASFAAAAAACASPGTGPAVAEAPLVGLDGSADSADRDCRVVLLHLPEGGRLFDHNRRPGDFDNYELSLANGFAVADDPSVCPGEPARPQPGWMGDVVVRLSRDDSSACDGVAIGDGFTYGTWERQRAVVRNVCFQVWLEGVTDWDNPQLWQQLDVRAHHQHGFSWVDLEGRVGNNARYAFPVGSIDPFAPYHCPEVPVTTNAAGEEVAVVPLSFSVNGAHLGPSGTGSSYTVTFVDYPSPWRQANCD